MSHLSNPFVSVIIPVFNDAERLKACLKALENQTYPKTLYEVIVVDNGSDEGIEGVVSQFGQAVATHESRPGSYVARNKGISLAKGDIIAFTDADCIPALDWIEKGVANLLRVPNCGLVAGKIEIFAKDPAHPTAVELFETLTALAQEDFLEEGRFGATANLFTFKSVIEDVGSFDSTLKSAGDNEWGKRVFSAGYKQIYADDTCVNHPARYSLAELYKSHVRMVGGLHDCWLKKTDYSLMTFIKDFRPPLVILIRILLGDIVWSRSDKKLSGLVQKLKFSLIFVFVKYVRSWEKLRLKLGGDSQRG